MEVRAVFGSGNEMYSTLREVVFWGRFGGEFVVWQVEIVEMSSANDGTA